jgi:hypothetical protein
MIARLCFILLRKEINFEPGFRPGESAIGHSPTPSSAASLRENRNVRLCKSALFAFQKTA